MVFCRLKSSIFITNTLSRGALLENKKQQDANSRVLSPLRTSLIIKEIRQFECNRLQFQHRKTLYFDAFYSLFCVMSHGIMMHLSAWNDANCSAICWIWARIVNEILFFTPFSCFWFSIWWFFKGCFYVYESLQKSNATWLFFLTLKPSLIFVLTVSISCVTCKNLRDKHGVNRKIIIFAEDITASVSMKSNCCSGLSAISI